ncbi:MAG TPA: class I SAM-dependent methyltransferase [Jiangellales bacterium]|nr:class I SAM-dependent methyltransferase [Jiangellales bacterium]
MPRLSDLQDRRGRALRDRVCRGLTGDVLEIGFGSGLNVPHYPPAVRRVLAVEPSDVAWRLAGRRIAASPVPVDRVGLDGQRVPLEDASVDSALSTLTLCTIPDPAAALAEVFRLLRPGGVLHFVEHGRAPEPRVARWQDRLQPLNMRLYAGCRLDLAVDECLAASDLVVEDLDRFYLRGPSPFGYLYLGRARRPSAGQGRDSEGEHRPG